MNTIQSLERAGVALPRGRPIQVEVRKKRTFACEVPPAATPASAQEETPPPGVPLAADAATFVPTPSAWPSVGAAVELRLLRLKEVMRLTGLARSTLYALIAANSFPAQVKLNTRSVAWRSDQVAVWLGSRTAA